MIVATPWLTTAFGMWARFRQRNSFRNSTIKAKRWWRCPGGGWNEFPFRDVYSCVTWEIKCHSGILLVQSCRELQRLPFPATFYFSNANLAMRLPLFLNSSPCHFQRCWTPVCWLSVGPTGFCRSPPVNASVGTASRKTAAIQAGNWTTRPVRRDFSYRK